MSEPDVRPARRRDLAELGLDDGVGPGFVMVAGDPPVAHVQVGLAKGHAVVERLDGDPAVRSSLVAAACDRLAALGQGQVLAAATAGEVAHNGCGQFIARYGKHAMAFVNEPEGKPRRLRGLCAKVVRSGAVRPGDEVVVVRPPA